MSHPVSPNGIYMEVMAGEPMEVYRIGISMKNTGNQMTRASATLAELSDSTSGMHGKAVLKLQESVGDSHVLLGEAGTMYTGIGEALRVYGWGVSDVQTQANNFFQQADDAWWEYNALPGDKDGRSYGWFSSEPEPGSAEERAHAREDAAKQAKYEEWESYALGFEGAYGDWEEAWNTAVEGVSAATDEGPSDGWSEWLGRISTILAWAGVIVAIAGMIIGGPLIALIAAVVGVLSLIVTIAQVALGDKSGWAIVWDVVGLIPFGKALKPLAAGDGASGAFKAMNKSFLGGVFSGDGRKLLKADWSAFTGGGFKGLFKNNNPLGFGDSFTRFITGKSATDFEKMASQGGRKLMAEMLDMQHALFGNAMKIEGNLSKATGHDNMKSMFPWLKILW